MELLASILAFVGIVCGVTALLDIGMNGWMYAEWAPWGLGIGLLCFLAIGIIV